MISWFEVSTGAIANADVARDYTKNDCNGPKHGRIFYSTISICHAGIVARARELPRLNFDQRLTKELRQT